MSVSKLLRVLAAVILDIFVLIFAFQYVLVVPEVGLFKLLFFLLFTIVGLGVWNIILLYPRKIIERFGVAYGTFIFSLLGLYPIVSILASILFLNAFLLWFIGAQLLIMFVVVLCLAIVVPFGKINAVEAENKQQEANTMDLLHMTLLQIDSLIEDRRNSENYEMCRNQYQILRERIAASTPLGRAHSNVVIHQMETNIIEHLHVLYQRIKAEEEQDKFVIQAKFEQILQLVKHREQLLIK